MHNVSMLKGGSRELWFVLTSEHLMWFKDDDVSRMLFVVRVMPHGTVYSLGEQLNIAQSQME